MYEFVTKKEYSPIRKEIEAIIKKVQSILREEDKDLSFQFRLVGSGGRHLITRIKGGNAGYDFDYNLILNRNYKWYPRTRASFFSAFQEAIKGTRFNAIENSTSVITIKQVSQKDKKVLVGCDFSVTCIPEDSEDNGNYYKYARFNKNYNNYTWEIRDLSGFSNEKLAWMMGYYDGIWNGLRDEYLKLKNNNPQKKHSFTLYYEAINNLYYRLK